MRVSNPKNLDYCVLFVLLNLTYALVNAQHISANTPINYYSAVFRDMYSPEELRRVRRPHGLPLVDHGGVPAEEGGVADVLVAHDPAEVGGGPPDVARAAKKRGKQFYGKMFVFVF